MAAEAGRSPSGSADSYIGSLISLTSKSEIRYEGLLFNINTQESSIGLRNVRSFGTEGRKKDGRYVPPSDKVYEYILFRGSDIKDLQVKSSPPVQTATPIHNDPAIIQSHYPHAPAASTSLASSGSGYMTGLSSHTAQAAGLPRPTFQGNLPLYQPGGSLAPPTTNGSSLAMPEYWQGYYGSSNGFQAQQQSLLQPPSGLPIPPSLQQTMQYPPNLPASQLSEAPLPLLPPLSTGSLNMQNSMPPTQYSATVSDWSKDLVPDKTSSQALPTAAPSTSLPFVSPLTSDFDKSSILPTATGMPKAIPSPIMPFRSVPELVPSVSGTSSSISNEVAVPSLVTPDQLLQPGPTTVSSFQSPQYAQKDVEVVQVSSSELPPATVATEAQEPLLPLPSQPDHKKHGGPTHAHQNTRRGRGRGSGRGRGRGNGVSRYVARFTEDFDFTAMNEKFNKDEVWGDLGKSNQYQEDGDLLAENDVGSSNNEPKPVYVKDDFFDSLSCDALNRGSRGGRTRFSEQMKLDTETFGEFSRNRGGRGGRGPTRGGQSRGGYYGRGRNGGYGYGGRGRAPPNSRPPN